MPETQSYNHHTRWDPLFHFFLLPVAVIGLVSAIVHFCLRPHPLHSVLLILFALAALVAIFKIRLYSLKVQDRVIRLEERLRLAALLPEALRARILELSEQQLIALRFASDAELAGLAERAMNGKLSPSDIKKSIKDWRPDYWRV